VDSFTGGNVLLTELFFVKRTPFPMRFGGSLGNMIDPMTQIRLRGRAHGELLLRVENPEKMIYGYFGMRKFQDHPDIFNWLTDTFFMTVKTTLGKLAREQHRTLVDIMDLTTELGNAFVANCQDLNEVGVRVVKVTKMEIDVPEEDLKRFDEMRQKVAEQMVGLQVDEIGIQRAALQAQADVARAQVGVQKASFDAQAKQYQLDQTYQQDARYVQNLAGSYQGYAAGQAMVGAGQGMAKGGESAGGAGAMAQLGVGVGVAGMFAQGAMQAGQAGAPQFNPGVAARVAVPGGPAAAAALIACTACNAHVAPAKFCAECGATMAAAPAGPKHCTGCNVELLAGAKFCPECGVKA
ncbi:MAG: zinc ribbon domain-containing protein, partial [Deltaproteobacteria bacterium]